MPNDALMVVESNQQLAISRPPEQVLEEAAKAATALKDVIEKKSKKVTFNGEQYLEFEDWQTLGRFYGITAKIVDTQYVEYGEIHGFEAKAIALRADGMEISAAEAACLTDEEKWRARPKYSFKDGIRQQDGEESVPLFQLKSMAQTRACAKVLRNVLAWVAVMAGYRPTPAEELDQHTTQANTNTAGNVGASHTAPSADVPNDGLLRVVDVQKKDGKNAATGRPWVRFTVTLSDGRSGSTFDEKVGEQAGRYRLNNTVVSAEFEQSGKYSNLTSLTATDAGEQTSASTTTKSDSQAPAGYTRVLTVSKMFKRETSPKFIIDSEEGLELLTDDQDAAKEALRAKKNGDKIEAKWREKTVANESGGTVVQRWLTDLSVVISRDVEVVDDDSAEASSEFGS